MSGSAVIRIEVSPEGQLVVISNVPMPVTLGYLEMAKHSLMVQATQGAMPSAKQLAGHSPSAIVSSPAFRPPRVDGT